MIHLNQSNFDRGFGCAILHSGTELRNGRRHRPHWHVHVVIIIVASKTQRSTQIHVGDGEAVVVRLQVVRRSNLAAVNAVAVHDAASMTASASIRIHNAELVISLIEEGAASTASIATTADANMAIVIVIVVDVVAVDAEAARPVRKAAAQMRNRTFPPHSSSEWKAHTINA